MWIRKGSYCGRPLVHCVFFYGIGIILGDDLLQGRPMTIFLGILILGMLVYCYFVGWKRMLIGMISLLLGVSFLLHLPIHQEQTYFKPKQTYRLVGQVKKVTFSPYYQQVVLKQVKGDFPGEKLKSCILVNVNDKEKITAYDEIELIGECQEITPQLNPSDMDYPTYLKSEQIVAVLKVKQIISISTRTPLIEQLRTDAMEQLEKLFHPNKVGIMEAALLGEDSKLEKATEEIYQDAGIGHVLCISGFHVGVMIGVMMMLFTLIPLPYALRQIGMILAISFYAYFTGEAPSTVRATIMVSVALLGKCLWQESDRLTTWAIAAGVLLLWNPYALFMAGVQLSFMAVLGVILCLEMIEKNELFVEWKYTKTTKTLMIWLCVQLFTWPVLAYHFFEIAFVMSLLNLVIIPLFSIIIIGGWSVLGLSFLPGFFGLAKIGSMMIEILLEDIEQVARLCLKIPLATLCVGRPKWIELALYTIMVFILGGTLRGWLTKKQMMNGLILGISLVLSIRNIQGEHLRINGLYIGQGDSTIIEMPKYGLFIIDGGQFGKGKTVERFIKYLGYSKIRAVMVSHSDADHIGGIIELLDTSLQIERIFVSKADGSPLMANLRKKCDEKHVPICAVEANDSIQYGQVSIECVAPSHQKVYANANDNSIVCKLSYGVFSALFTGDFSKDTEPLIFDHVGPIHLLKVSHHGSRTGTSREMLLKLKPSYAMISCGRGNLYGHPHQEVLKLFQSEPIKVQRTDLHGAICYETDGTYLKEISYREES